MGLINNIQVVVDKSKLPAGPSHTVGPWKRNRTDSEYFVYDSRPEPTTTLQLMMSKNIPMMINLESLLNTGTSKVDLFNQYLRHVGVKNTDATELFVPRRKELAEELGYSTSYPETFLEYLPLPWFHRQVLVCWVFQQLRDHLGEPITIYNSYRPFAYNKAVGGASKSDHIYACAIDMNFRSRDSRRKAEAFLKDFRDKNPELQISLGLGDLNIHLGVNSPGRARTWTYDSYVP